MAKFSGVKVGNTVYHLLYGKGEVTVVWLGGGIVTNFLVKFKTRKAMFDVDGYLLDEDSKHEEKIVTLYWNEVKLPNEEEDEKPFDLVEYLRENLQPTEFRVGEENFYLYFEAEDEKWYSFSSEIDIAITVYFKTCTREIVEDLAKNKVTVQQLKQAYKELGWL